MAAQLVRIIKRRSSFNLDRDEFYRVEFLNDQGEPDLSLSVFEIDPNLNLIQLQTEQLVGIGINPDQRCSVHLDGLSGWSGVLKTPTTNRVFNFKFASDTHRELQFVNNQVLLEFVFALQSNLQNHRLVDVSKTMMKSYALQQLDKHDEEWTQVAKNSEKFQIWITK